MAKGMSGWVPAIVAILTILSGSLRSTVAEQDLLQINVGSWTLTNDLDSAVTIHCSNQFRDFGTVTLQSMLAWSHQWTINPNFNFVFTCNFKWNSQQMTFIIWAQDDPKSYLATCDRCQWQIQQDGFYFLQNNGQFVREVVWL